MTENRRPKNHHLALASYYGDVACVECLLRHGARFDLTDMAGHTSRKTVELAMWDCPGLRDRRDRHQQVLAILDSAQSKSVSGNSAPNTFDQEKANQLREAGSRYFKAGDLETAIREYTASLGAAEDGRGFNNRCLCYLDMAKRARARDAPKLKLQTRQWYQLAIHDAVRATGFDPPSAKAYFQHAISHIGFGDFPRALIAAEEGLSLLGGGKGEEGGGAP